MGKKIKWTAEQETFICKRYSTMKTKDLCKLVNETYGMNVNEPNIRYVAERNGLQRKNFRFNEEQAEFVRERYGTMSRKEIVDEFNARYGTNINKRQLDTFRVYQGGVKPYRTPHEWTAEQTEWIKQNYGTMLLKDLVEAFNKHFNTNVELLALRWHATKNGFLQTDIDKQRANTRRLVMKKNMGQEREYNGDIYVKVGDWRQDEQKEKGRTWQLKSRVVWEREHGKIPNGYNVKFIDGNKRNFDINNLMLVKQSVMLRINQSHSMTDNADLNKSIIMVETLKDAIRQKERKQKENE